MTTITISSVSASGSTLESTLDIPSSLRRFFATDTFRTTYDCEIAGLDESILAIPVVGQVAPVAWANGANIQVPALDSEYTACLASVQEVLRSMYPEFMAGGEILVDRRVDTPDQGRDGAGLLYSGGVDSLTSFAQNQNEVSTLIGVQGWTVGPDDDEWEDIAHRTRNFAQRHGVESRFICTNTLSMLDTTMLQAHFKRYLVGSWYSGVGHGLGLLSLCAPLSVAAGLDQLYIASTHTKEFEHSWGSHPTIDNNVRWTGTTARHDGFELSRQEKVYRLVEFIEESDPELTIYTCNRGETTNCSECEKCYRTAFALMLAECDPVAHGYDIRPDQLGAPRQQIESGDWLVDEDVLFMWKDLQDHASDGFDHESPAVREFCSWLDSVDLDDCFEQGTTTRENPQGRLFRSVARHTPYPVYATVFPLVDLIRNLQS